MEAQQSNAEANQQRHPAHAPDMPIVAVIGDGQLARMMQTAAIELGQSLRLLASSNDASAAQVCSDVLLGDYTNLEDVRRAAQGADAVTFDHEHVPNEHLDALIAQGVNVQPRPEALIYAQDKLEMRKKLQALGAPVPPFARIDSVEDALAFWDQVQGEVCLKARRGGYDGHGVWFPDTREALATQVGELLEAGTPLMAEEKVALRGELSAMVARTPSGATQAWPVVESVQRDGVCAEAVAPAPNLDVALRQQAEELSVALANGLGVTGVLAVELFVCQGKDGAVELSVNELAMRPHNTGHWTQDGCCTSQFEQHLRAVLDLPLGDTHTTANYTVMANVLGAAHDPAMPMNKRVLEVMRRYPKAKIHLYGKEHRPGRKIAHVNFCGEHLEATRNAAQAAAHFLVHATWPEQSSEQGE
ncbi:5-(carboxyamino)imidazole ribonucleotide synthase [Corynebacterium pseudopelargi]|uniref:5-(carboxyamino)imidazole ribonucleotide synthase n=1 Tax=Corynebacterium pseudopelargi TaxID=2080757 RepID=UPI002482EB2E|nr:5-(carboxyamino)imidazole ribonucleotide synthase [Corynebacterium pseudopelargi]